MRDGWRALALAVRTSFQADRARSWAIFGLVLVSSVRGVLIAYSLKVIVDAAARGDQGGALLGAIVIGAVTGAGMLSNASVTRMLFPLKEHTGALLDQRLIGLIGGIATIEHHERPEYLARIEVLRRDGHVLATVGYYAAGVLEAVVQAVATGVVLVAVDARLLAVPLCAVPSFWAGARAERLRQDAVEHTASDARRARQLFALATSPAPSKELRVYGLGGELLERHGATSTEIDARLDRAARRGLLWSSLASLIFAAGYAAAIVLVVRGAVDGTATVGDVVLTIAVVAQINEQVGGAIGSVTTLARTVTVASRYRWLIDYAAARRAAPEAPAPVPNRLVDGISAHGVGFRYPGVEANVLDDVDLVIPAGTVIAIVGENGAGKSTLVKLLCRLYEPSQGSILVDGEDVRRFDVEGWRLRVSAGFQDFGCFELLARETVGIGDLPFIDDVGVVRAAVQRGGAGEVIDDLPKGLDTQLGTSFDGGIDLSGGQWQRLALARAMMRRTPLLLVLDEPTASVDADTEHALFSRYSAAARATSASVGTITVLVSHRFSTVRMADQIVVLDGGRIVENGSHQELMAAAGAYAELYELQAESYR